MTAKVMDIEQTRQCLELLDQWRASGLAADAFERQHELNFGRLRAWQAHEPRWRARLAGQPYVSQRSQAQQARQTKTGFVALSLPAANNHTGIRIECSAGPRSATVYWPLASTSLCAQWLREFLA